MIRNLLTTTLNASDAADGECSAPPGSLKRPRLLWLSTQMLKEQAGLEHDRPPSWEAPEKAQVSTWPLPDTGGDTCSLTQTANLKNKEAAMREAQPVTIKKKPGPRWPEEAGHGNCLSPGRAKFSPGESQMCSAGT